MRTYSPFRGSSPYTPRSHDPRHSTQPWRTPSRRSSRTRFNCGKPGHFPKDCRAPRNNVHFDMSRPTSTATAQGPHGPARVHGRGYRGRGRQRTSPWPGKPAAVRIGASTHRATQRPGVKPKGGPPSQRACALPSSSTPSVPCCVSLSTAPEELCETSLHGAPDNIECR